MQALIDAPQPVAASHAIKGLAAIFIAAATHNTPDDTVAPDVAACLRRLAVQPSDVEACYRAVAQIASGIGLWMEQVRDLVDPVDTDAPVEVKIWREGE